MRSSISGSRHGGRGAAAYRAEVESIGALLVTPRARISCACSSCANDCAISRRTSRAVRTCSCCRRRHHGRRHRSVVRAARAHRHAAGSRAKLRRPRARAGAKSCSATGFARPATLRTPRLASEGRSRRPSGRLRRPRDRGDRRRTRKRNERSFATSKAKLRSDALVATNTSSIRLEELSPALRPSGAFRGSCISSIPCREPAARRGHPRYDTSDATLENAISFVIQIGKLPLPCRSAPGFVVNRDAHAVHARGVARARGRPLARDDRRRGDSVRHADGADRARRSSRARRRPCTSRRS